MNLYIKLLKKIAHIQVEHPYLTVLFIVMLSLAIYGGVSSVRTVASLEQMMPKDIEEIKAFNTLRDNAMGQDTIGIILQIDRDADVGNIDITSYDIYRYVLDVEEVLRSKSDIIEVYSPASILGDIDERSYSDSMDAINLDDSLLSSYINKDRTTLVIIATTDVSASDERMQLLATSVKESIKSLGSPSGVKILYTGTPIIQQRLGELISADRSNTQWISTLLVFIITMIIFGTFSSAVVPIIVVTISVNWLYGTMGYTGLPISTLAGGVAAMVIGIGIDFAIHIMNKFKYERKKGMSIKHGIEQAVVDTGVALTATSITTIAAFLAFLAGVMPEMGRFGILMAIGITYSLLFSLFGLPALLVIEEDFIKLITRKAHFGVEGEYMLANGKKCDPKDVHKHLMDGKTLHLRRKHEGKGKGDADA
ncbi:MMPL family transporter [Candidatus Woesearchaeota archaeon]|nr:MMPL family transporter [Candidatus Woesearchaeota archaeon]